jgi:hypothetical protein
MIQVTGNLLNLQLLPMALFLVLAGCGPANGNGGNAENGGPPAQLDGGSPPSDAGEASGDGGGAGADSGDSDAGLVQVPLEGFGEITGECGVVHADALLSPSPALFTNTIDFADDPFDDPEDVGQLSEGGQEIVADGNAGGGSLASEIFAFEVLHRCELATLLKTETEVVYVDDMGKITDLLVSIHGQKVGVSVTRAFPFPRDSEYPVAQAQGLLEDKLADVLESSARVSADDAWVKQILHVITDTEASAASVDAAWNGIDPAIKADTVVVLTITEGSDDFVY